MPGGVTHSSLPREPSGSSVVRRARIQSETSEEQNTTRRAPCLRSPRPSKTCCPFKRGVCAKQHHGDRAVWAALASALLFARDGAFVNARGATANLPRSVCHVIRRILSFAPLKLSSRQQSARTAEEAAHLLLFSPALPRLARSAGRFLCFFVSLRRPNAAHFSHRSRETWLGSVTLPRSKFVA